MIINFKKKEGLNLHLIDNKLSHGVIASQHEDRVSFINSRCMNRHGLLLDEMSSFKPTVPSIRYKNLFKFVLNNKIKTLHIRSIIQFVYIYMINFLLFRRINLVYEFRGLVSEESYLRNNSKFRKILLTYLESFAYRKSTKVIVVSNEFKKYLENKYYKKNIEVLPCCISTNLKKTRKKIKNPVMSFVYLGGVSKWQKFDAILKLYSRIECELLNTKLTVITNNTSEAKDLIGKTTIQNINIKSLTHEEVKKDLVNYDFGFLIRDNILLNNVASPIKYLEYIGNGVIPIISEGVGDYTQETINNNIGIVVDKYNNFEFSQIYHLINDNLIFERLSKVSEKYLWRNQVQEDCL